MLQSVALRKWLKLAERYRTETIQPNEAMLVEKPLRVSKNYLRLTNLHIDNQFTLQSCSYLMKNKKESLPQYIPR